MLSRTNLGFGGALTGLLLSSIGASAITLDTTNVASIKSAVTIAASNAWTFYPGWQKGQQAGLLVNSDQADGYYWWEGGAMFGLFIQQWSLTGNAKYNDDITTAILNQIGPAQDFEPPQQQNSEGNDDQVYWAFAAMDAVEQNFPDPASPKPSWLALAQAVFNAQVTLWDPLTCNGGMRWQIQTYNAGYDYKNTIANGGFFQLAARLARYTGNATYAQMAERSWNWIEQSAIFDNSTAANAITVWDGIRVANCSSAQRDSWSVNPTTWMVGAAYMWNYYNSSAASDSTLSLWEERITLLGNGTDLFYTKAASDGAIAANGAPSGVVLRELCELPSAVKPCNQDQPVFKAFATRWQAITAHLAPFSAPFIAPRLVGSAQAAAQQCTGTSTSSTMAAGTVCGQRWYQSKWDEKVGLGEQLSAMSAFQSLLLPIVGTAGGTAGSNAGSGKGGVPLTAKGGGTSKSNPGAGSAHTADIVLRPITTADRIGAGVVTLGGLVLACFGLWWMIVT